MKILVFGAGVIGTTYAWQMSEAGHDVTLFVRKQRLVRYSHSGVTIMCTDMRGKKKEFTQTVFRPKTTDRLDSKIPYDLIIVALKNFQLNDAVPYIAKFSGNAHIMFLGNLWNEFSLIEKHLPKGRYFFGFPGMAGGGRTENSVNCYLFKNGYTFLGEPDGKTSQRLKETYIILESAGMQPKASPRIVPWLQAHYVWPAATLGPVIKAGGARMFAENNKLIKQSVMAMKEGYQVCRKKGIPAGSLFPYSMFFLPASILAYLMKKSYSPEMQAVIEAHMKHGFDELKKQFYDIFNEGKALGVSMPYWTSFEKYVKEYAQKHQQ